MCATLFNKEEIEIIREKIEKVLKSIEGKELNRLGEILEANCSYHDDNPDGYFELGLISESLIPKYVYIDLNYLSIFESLDSHQEVIFPISVDITMGELREKILREEFDNELMDLLYRELKDNSLSVSPLYNINAVALTKKGEFLGGPSDHTFIVTNNEELYNMRDLIKNEGEIDFTLIKDKSEAMEFLLTRAGVEFY